MKLIVKALTEVLAPISTYFNTQLPHSDHTEEHPLRAELFSSEQLSEYGKKLAKTHKLNPKPVKGSLLHRLSDNEKILNDVRKLLTEAVNAKSTITPAGEWLIDNFYLIDEQIRTAKKHLPKEYNENLPQLISRVPGLLRVYDIALQLISHSDGRIDLERLSSFIKSYQSGSRLKLGELWAIPIMLRLTLIENLRRIGSLISSSKIDTNLANYWSTKMLEVAEKDPKSLVLMVGDMARSNPPMSSAFVSEMHRQLLGKGPALALALTWIEQKLNEESKTSNELIKSEIQKQTINQASVSNSISSLHLLNALDWRNFVEEHSVVEQMLRKDYGGTYPKMDFTTRNNYRNVVERISKQGKIAEEDVAQIAIKLAFKQTLKEPIDYRKTHVGYYLVDEGLTQTEKIVGLTTPILFSLRSSNKLYHLIAYLSSILLITLGLTTLFLLKAYASNISAWASFTVTILLLISSSQFAVAVVNFFSTLVIKPHFLPRMDFSQAIPDDSQTLVVVPAMLTNRQAVKDLVKALEIRFLANRDKNLYFGLLTDFVDADQETLPTDLPLLQLAHKRIEELKKRHEKGGKSIFFLFHRSRQWNAGEKLWMGYERKRGKLGELNELLQGGSSNDLFSSTIGDLNTLKEVKYVITLDSDTQLPRGTAWKMIATMAHPLNHAKYDQIKKRVIEGYGILQPRVGISVAESSSSFYSQLHSSDSGIDPYTRAVSDVYQDLFAEGSFIGKGIYDVNIFEKTLKGRFNENSILSHDLLEGCYVRSGLLSDVELYEKYPSTYHSDMKRFSRWTRGDWQIFSWFLPYVPSANGSLTKNPLSALSRWKIFDNIRRSLVSISLISFIILAWTSLRDPLFWTIAITAIIISPVLITLTWNAFKKPKDVILNQHISLFLIKTRDIIIQTSFSLICLPYEAFVNFVAIVRTIWRMLISHAHLLEWDVFSKDDYTPRSSLAKSYLLMWVSPFLALVLSIYFINHNPNKLIIASPILLLWAIAPYITWLVGKPLITKKDTLTDKQIIFLRKIARKTWGFFERFVGPEENWLPPDNFQHHPAPVVAHYTSPTNIGMSLLSNLSAHDFGYISTNQFFKRTSFTLDTLKKLEKYRGHLYNWYSTKTLEPLLPKYISSVDSGNMAGHLLTLRQGIFEMIYQKIARVKVFEGLQDTLNVLKETLDQEDIDILYEFAADLETECSKQHTPSSIYKGLKRLMVSYESIVKQLNKKKTNAMAEWWKDVLAQQLQEAIEEIQLLSPWFSLPAASNKFLSIIHIDNQINIGQLLKKIKELIPNLHASKNNTNTEEENAWLDNFIATLKQLNQEIEQQIEYIKTLANECAELANMEWDFLYDKSRNLLTIGYRVEEHTTDPGYYDLLASEARLSTFVGIAQNKLPEESWFSLGRLITNTNNTPILVSWGGSMFEYLMPLLIMPTYENTLIDQTYKIAVKQQIDYGKQRGTPWGISESGYNMVDSNSNYQYQAFGVPGLGLKRGMEADLVIAPYATALSLMVAPKQACENLELLSREGFEGDYGFYEAIDYTPSRLPRGQSRVVIQSFMAHHQGMSLVALNYLLQKKPMQRRFEAEPQFRASLLLLQERIPTPSTFFAPKAAVPDFSCPTFETKARIISTPDTLIPEVQLLSNNNYHMMITNAGGGYLRWKNIAVTRWREDVTCDNWGSFCYIRDVDTGQYWSNTHQPTLKKGKKYEAAFSQGRVDFHTSNNDIDTHTEIVISPEDDIELRRLHITNKSATKRVIEITSYAEVVLAPAASDAMQPAFSNLFVQTEILPQQHAIICSRRPSAANKQLPWMFHTMILNTNTLKEYEISYETDRMEFIGHGNTVAYPNAMHHTGPLSGKQGSVLDPIVAIRYKITLEPEEVVMVDLVMGVSDTRELCEELIVKYQDKHHKNRVFELAWTHSQVILRQINATGADEQLFEHLASAVIFTNQALRASSEIITKNQKGQSGLWGYAISGDLPIVLVQITDPNNIVLAKQLIQAHTYWRLKGLTVDLVIWNDDHGGYRQVLHDQIHALIPYELLDRPGGIFVRTADQIPYEDRILFQTVARVNISDTQGTLLDHLMRKPYSKSHIPYISNEPSYLPQNTPTAVPSNLQFFNGLGGYSANDKEYVINLDASHRTPLPWVNVLANPNFGTVVTESGHSYTWIENAHEMRLTPWNNDIVCNSTGEIFYLRDEENGHFWSATALPRGKNANYLTRHGFGYSIFEHIEDGIYSEMTVYVDLEQPIKFTVIKIRNNSGKRRHLSATGYTEWVMGDLRSKTAMHVLTEVDPETSAFFAQNPYNTEFASRVSFFDTDETNKTFTGDRIEFIGRNGNVHNPDAMRRLKLSCKTGVALDPCAALQVTFELEDGEEREIVFRLGAGKDRNQAIDVVKQFRGPHAARKALEQVRNYWQQTTSTLQVETPDESINILTNGWLTYQTLACRLWGRSGYYQSGGAFGFRDQLQDVLSILHIEPTLARKQILLCAAHQFQQGDVQHWWHPPTGRGVRTRISDDYLWLPFVTCRYVQHTGDIQILDELSYYLEGRPLNAGEESYYELPIQSKQQGSLYDHCVSAINNGLNFGEHGLPLMGTGDWNDGMDRVGHHGKGESVWLGFFLYDVLTKFITIAKLRNDTNFATRCKKQAEKLEKNLNEHGWDGKWYRRAYFDDGTPLGSATGTDCQIDSISQSWSVLSGAAAPERKEMAMRSVENRLIKKDAGVIQLLDPPFDKAPIDPGYIKGYVPGVRENGGQYTHAAIWTVMAFAKLGDKRRTWELLQMINPLNHGKTQTDVATYKVEPYVVAADVYACTPHTGRGGWTWYTGSASWMYQLIIESFLGLKFKAGKISFTPCIPPEWESFKVHYRYQDTIYHITVEQKNTEEKMNLIIDGEHQKDEYITLVDDGMEHNVRVLLGKNIPTESK